MSQSFTNPRAAERLAQLEAVYRALADHGFTRDKYGDVPYSLRPALEPARGTMLPMGSEVIAATWRIIADYRTMGMVTVFRGGGVKVNLRLMQWIKSEPSELSWAHDEDNEGNEEV